MLLNQALAVYGTKTALARELGVTVQTLVGWWVRGIPRHAVARLRSLVQIERRADTPQEAAFVEVEIVGEATERPSPKGNMKAIDRVPAYAPWAKKTDRCIRVTGGSMSPQFNDGDIVGIRKWARPLEELRGKFVVVLLKESMVVRRLNVSKHFVILEALKPDEPNIYLERRESPEIWRVEWWHGHQP